jgi:Tfp pilus assembly protein PilF
VMRITCALLFALASALPLHAQSAQEWIARGHEAARASRHADAIAAYERAIAADSSVRTDLLASLGRQYLWSDQPARAADMLTEYLATHTGCDVRNDLGLALAWSDRLRHARDVLGDVIDDCPSAANTARLRLAVVYRWLGRPSRAQTLYRQALTDSATAADARLGLAFVLLQQEYNRAAADAFRTVGAGEGEVLARARLGEYGAARTHIDSVMAGGTLSRDMQDLQRNIEAFDRVVITPAVRRLHDADGTRFTSYELSASRAMALRGRAGALLRQWELSYAGSGLRTTHGAIHGEYRWNPALAARAEIGLQHVHSLEWTPATGELNAIITPSDVVRIDASAARMLVTDHMEAMRSHLAGTLVGAGTDVRVTSTMTVVAATDVTFWSTDNRRMRVRTGLRWRPEGSLALTVELPMMLQLYDEPMPFAFFSPERYVEAGPGAHLDLRVTGPWRVSLYARAGVQREDDRPWDPFGSGRVAVWRELSDEWALRASAAWSDSNVASSTSFRRTSLELNLVRAF